jgi:signal peptidase II
VKFRLALGVVLLILILDQILKIYIKTHFYLGETYTLSGNWAKLYFTENEGMAFGMSFGGIWGKYVLSIFRLIACIWGLGFLYRISKKQIHNGFLLCVALILAGAIGNLLDSMFYGLIFDNSSYHTNNIAKLTTFGKGYGTFLQGKVVDMFYFPLIQSTWPSWVPLLGGKAFVFFNAIFNLADVAISTGVITLLVFQKKLLSSFHKEAVAPIDNNDVDGYDSESTQNEIIVEAQTLPTEQPIAINNTFDNTENQSENK